MQINKACTLKFFLQLDYRNQKYYPKTFYYANQELIQSCRKILQGQFYKIVLTS